jgi:predicted phage baseplate assembly protein
VTPDPGFPPYQSSPRVGAVSAITIGGTVEAVNAVTVTDEDLGVAEGVPGQRFQLRRGPVLAGDQPAVLAVQVGVDAKGDPIHETWQQVEHFSDSRPDDRHFVLDSSAGEIRLGPAVRLEDGSLRRYGATPLKGQRLRMVEYRTGGGRHGNLAAGALTVMKSSIPFVARVENRRDATGGVDGEDIESAKVRGPIRLRTRGRAVTTEDYEQLAREAAPDVGRVRAVAGGDGAEVGAVRVLIVPRVPSQDGRLEFARMFPDPQLVETITSRLEECRVIGARVLVGRPSYEGVTVVASVTPATGVNPDRLKADTTRALYEYLHPLIGGPDGDGWPFGRPVSVGEVYSILQKVTGVDVVEGIELYRAIAETGERKEQVQRLELGTHTLIFSVDHQVGVPGAD